jgi:hypothetical protein
VGDRSPRTKAGWAAGSSGAVLRVAWAPAAAIALPAAWRSIGLVRVVFAWPRSRTAHVSLAHQCHTTFS